MKNSKELDMVSVNEKAIKLLFRNSGGGGGADSNTNIDSTISRKKKKKRIENLTNYSQCLQYTDGII